MGSYRFRFSTIIPNSWFHSSTKVKNKITKTQPITTSSPSSSSSSFPSTQPADYNRKSYYFTRDLTLPDLTTRIQDPSPPETRQPDPPRKSTKKKRPYSPKKPISQKSVSPEHNPAARCSCGITTKSVSEESNPSDTEVKQSINCSCKTNNSYDVFGKVDLPPIITKPVKQDEFGSGKWVIDGESRGLSVRVVKQGISGSPSRKVKGNGYSPRLGNRVRVNGINGRRRNGSRRSLSESLAVVKTSVDPGRDFKESMVEMIMENNIKSSKDLEDLLACYLSLNCDEYHDLIIKVFKQIWFESTDIRL
ncbi:hypothetical protein L1987_03620 [Smallanthus sonchifolius]|uniref:Uncharacterized protein n=1 Tax=Smallanthus sonchifolius TaxID=185202 RepID=A0ACB9KBB1_9ASTR|nr:hypothetical protein L1987_03620 [Smallanthus sonchifolius]